MRIGGLASGMDTDSMVKELMKAESMKVDRVKADKQILEWKKESLNSLNKDFANFILDTKKDLGYNSTTGRPGSLDWVKQAVSSDDSIGTATVGKGTFGGKHTVNVTKFAKGVSGASEAGVKVTEDSWKTARKEVTQEGPPVVIVEPAVGDFEFKVNGHLVSVKETDSLSDIARKINTSGSGVQASYDEKLGTFFLRTDKEGKDAKIEFTNAEGRDKDGKLNTDKDIPNQKGLERFLNTIKVELKGYQYDIDGNSTAITQKLTSDLKISGLNGEAIYNDVPVEIDSNQFTINGIKFDAKVEGQAFTVTVSDNTDAIVDKVKQFVDNYNKLMEKAGTLLTEKQNKGYRPLTEEQKEAMSDKEVELWEKKAKSGLISRDRDLEKMMTSLRTNIYGKIDNKGTFEHISQIGITTQQYKPGGVGGQLQIDEDKLREMIAKDPDGVMELLFKEDEENGTIDDSVLAAKDRKDGTNLLKTKKANSGLFTTIFDELTNGMKDIISKSGHGGEDALFRKVKSNIMADFVKKGGRYSGKGSISDLDSDMSMFTKKIDTLNAALFRKENMYYAKFTAMEKAMQQMSAQSGWLQQQM